MSTDPRTLQALDWPDLIEALAEQARTAAGGRAIRRLAPLPNVAAIRAAHDAVDELRALEREGLHVPIGAVEDIGADVIAARKGEVLAPDRLRLVGAALVGLVELRHRLDEAADDAPTLYDLALGITLDPWLVDQLTTAFDPSGQLSAARWPELGELRAAIAALHEEVRRTLEALLRDDTWQEILQDQFVTQRGDRYVLPVKDHAKRWDLGIVHGTSGSGRTVYVEPSEVIALNNRLRVAEGKLEALEKRILSELSAHVGAEAESLQVALESALQLDLCAARAGLADRLDLNRPAVGETGAITLTEARHPVLALRGVAVVPNDLAIAAGHGLVLTGPNTGGKTVAMKTLGLCALLVGVGCFVPAAEGSRVDRFDDVRAVIGDAQTVQGDLSSFSAHLVSLREVLGVARPGALILLDELCTGTDPGQGAALARAVVEALLDAGASVVLTTHFAQLKAMSAADVRVARAAVGYAEGRPTWKVHADATGESHAFDTALRMGLAPELLERARALLGTGERVLGDALSALEAERSAIFVEARAQAARAAALAEREAEIARRLTRVAEREAAVRDEAAAAYRERLAKAEKAIAAVVAELQRSPSHLGVTRARATVDALAALAPEPEAQPAQAPAALAPTDRVRLTKVNQYGEVVSVSGGSAQVRVGALTVKVPLTELERLGAAFEPARPAATAPPAPARAAAPTDPDEAVRLPGNTLDLRGKRVEEGLDEVDTFLDHAAISHWEAVFLLHGHGTGAMKQAVREHLRKSRYVLRFGPANADQGGDAFTVVVLRP